ncbi:hypothetical protein ACJIZ3_022685 [Penstemon smallii]|uniref:Uncharacterized protein n=1 Tax=Penstemon smallii TaxID=265156 RepID=A0ABD3TM01_9LAMI
MQITEDEISANTICLMAMSKDFFESVLPKPELSGDDEDFPDKLLLWGTGTELPLLRVMPFGGRPLAGEHDCRLVLPFEAGSTDDDRELGAPGLPLVAEGGLSGRDVLKFGGTSSENPGMSEGFHGLGLVIGELDRATEEEVKVALDTAVGLRVGVAALDVGFEAGTEGLRVGVDDLTVDLAVGVEDLGGTVGFAEGKEAREVGVEDLEDFDVVDDILEDVVDVGLATVLNMGLFDADVKLDLDVERPVGVAGLDAGPPEEDGLRSPPLEESKPGDVVGCLDDILLLAAGSSWRSASFNHREEFKEIDQFRAHVATGLQLKR